MTPEGKIEAYLKKRVLTARGSIRKVRWLDRRGAPDRFVWWKGPNMAFVEVKAPNKKLKGLTRLQLVEHARLRRDGFAVYVIDSEAGVDAFIAEMTA
jgi:hypothetical protein